MTATDDVSLIGNHCTNMKPVERAFGCLYVRLMEHLLVKARDGHNSNQNPSVLDAYILVLERVIVLNLKDIIVLLAPLHEIFILVFESCLTTQPRLI